MISKNYLKKIKVGIIGLGVGEKHLQALLKNEKCEIVSVCDLDKKKLLTIKKKYKVHCTTNSNNILNNKEINMVSIASYDNHHFNHARKALKNNKHVFIEKPAVLKESQLIRLKKILNKKKKLAFFTNVILRKSERFIKLKKNIKKNYFGEIYYIEADYNYGRLYKILNGWRSNIPYYSVTLGGGIHMIDLIMWLTEKRILEVSSYSNKIVTKNKKFKHHDFSTSILKFKDGKIAKVSSNFGCVYPHFHKLSVYGKNKTFENDFKFAKIFKKRESYNFEKDKTKLKPDDKGALITDFIEILNNTLVRKKLIKDTFDSLSVCFAIEKSIKINQKVKVKYI